MHRHDKIELVNSAIIICNVICFLVIFPITSAQYNQDECKTPRQEDGVCILLTKCPAINDILKQRPISPADVEYVRKSGCGFEGLDAKVCCPTSSPTTSTTFKPRPTSPSLEDGEGEGPLEEVPTQSGDLLPAACGVRTDTKIVGGKETELGEFPWMALLEYQTRNGKGFYCGGVLISSRYVLTAAHCIKGKDLPTTWRLISVRLGEYNTSSAIDCIGGFRYCLPPPQDIPIEAQIAHEDYDPFDVNQYHDIALLRLSSPANLTVPDSVSPICLPKGEFLSNTFENEDMVVAGWGKTENKSTSDVMLKLTIKIRERDYCVKTYKNVKVKINEGQMCAGGQRGQDSCRGDSGGPLMAALQINSDSTYHALGVVSFGPSPCGLQGWPGVYTRVTKYMPWIINNLRP